MLLDGIGGALADLALPDVDAAHACLRAEKGMNVARRAVQIALAQIETLLGEHDDAAALGRLIRERSELRGVGELFLADTRGRDEGGRPGGCRA